ncbi:MAG TPA: ethanolamine ammonia-lyase subunit EutC [Candidatus Binatia bacterium]
MTRLPSVIPAAISREVLGRHTAARVALGRAGASLPTRAHLAFVGDHARARDAVWTAVDFDALAAALGARSLVTVRLHSRAPDRATYLRRPDLGRLLDDASLSRLASLAEAGGNRIAIVIADGLSAEAVQTNAVAVVEPLVAALEAQGSRVACVALVEQGRVAVGDPVGEALGADLVVVLIGERPGLSAADSLGCYVTWAPRPGTPDSRRNCISNIRCGGLIPADAAARIAWLVGEATKRRLTGVALKQEEVPVSR